MSLNIKIGIIGGSGLDDPDILEDREEKVVTTPFGDPSDVLILGTIKGVNCVLLARHGRKHTVYPSAVNYRANVHALKAQGCTHILVSTACGSLRDEMEPGDMVVLDQFIDRTTKRVQTFYDGSTEKFKGVCHMPMAKPFCAEMGKILTESLCELGMKHHEKGTIVTIEGPRFSTQAESFMFKGWGADLINMTTVPEVVLAAEAGLCYAAVALVTDYDCWKESDHVSVDAVMNMLKSNSQHAMEVFVHTISKMASKDWTDIVLSKQMMASSSFM